MKKIKILGKEYSIKRFENDIHHMLDFGYILYKEAEIGISKDISVDHANETLLHEVIHVVNHYMSLEMNEAGVTALSACLYSFLKDNGIKVDIL